MSMWVLAIVAALKVEPAMQQRHESAYRRSHADESCIDWLASLPDAQAYIDRLDRGELRALECELSSLDDSGNAEFQVRYAIWAAGGERADALVDSARDRTRSDIAFHVKMAHDGYAFLPEIGMGRAGCIEGMPEKGRTLMEFGRPDRRREEVFHCDRPDPSRSVIERLAGWIIRWLAPGPVPREDLPSPVSDLRADAEPESDE